MASERTEDGTKAAEEGAGRRPRVRAGVYAALSAEAVFVGVVAAMSFLAGRDPWKVAKVPAAFLIGPAATRPEGFAAGDILLGLLMHLLFAALIGVLYGLLLRPLRLSPLTGGLLAGGLLYLFGFWLLPALFPEWLEPFRLPVAGKVMQALAHLIYGFALGLFFARQSNRAA